MKQNMVNLKNTIASNFNLKKKNLFSKMLFFFKFSTEKNEYLLM